MLNCNCGNSAVVCTSRPAPVVAPRRACSSPCRRNATAEPPLFSAMLDQGTCVAQQRACQPPCPRSLDRDLHKLSELSGTRAPVVAHNGHNKLVQEQHLGNLHGKCTVCTVRTCCSQRAARSSDVSHLRRTATAAIPRYFVLSGPTSPVEHSNGHVNTCPRTAPGPENLSLHTTGQ